MDDHDSSTLQEVVDEYIERFGEDPPERSRKE